MIYEAGLAAYHLWKMYTKAGMVVAESLIQLFPAVDGCDPFLQSNLVQVLIPNIEPVIHEVENSISGWCDMPHLFLAL